MNNQAMLAIINLILALIQSTIRIIILVWFYYAISDIRQDVHSMTWEGKQCQLPIISEGKK